MYNEGVFSLPVVCLLRQLDGWVGKASLVRVCVCLRGEVVFFCLLVFTVCQYE